MPFDCHLVPSLDLGVIRLSGLVTGRQAIDAVRSLYGDDDWTSGGRVLWDGTAIAALDFAPDQADALSETVFAMRDRIGDARIAIVVGDSETYSDTYSSGLLFAVRSRKSFDREIEVFDGLAPALAWLGIDGLPPPLAAALCS